MIPATGFAALLEQFFTERLLRQRKASPHRERTPRLQRVCGRKVGRRRPTCLAEPIKPFTSFQWRLPKREPGCRLA
jgi:hypothetical protein